MSEISAGVQALVNRMKTNPEEFFDPKKENEWSFIYSETFRDIMTEPEKAAIHTALKAVRRTEFESKIMKRILKADAEKNYGGVPEYAVRSPIQLENPWK